MDGESGEPISQSQGIVTAELSVGASNTGVFRLALTLLYVLPLRLKLRGLGRGGQVEGAGKSMNAAC